MKCLDKSMHPRSLQYFATNPQFKVSSTAVYDSVTLQLQFDLYHYGSMAADATNHFDL